MTRKHIAVTMLTTAAFVGGAVVALAQAGSSDRMKTGSDAVPAADQQFMMKAAQGGMAEVQLGNLAKDHASSQAVKDFGQHMVDDHTKANDELKDLASRKNVTLPSAVDAKDQATMDRLSKLNGAAFDRAYMKDMVMDHKKDVAEFQKEANSGRDSDVKSWASKTLPTLQQHLQMAQSTK